MIPASSGVPYQVSLTPIPHHANGHPTPLRYPRDPPIHPPPTHATDPSPPFSHLDPRGQPPYQDAVTSGARLISNLTQRAAAMQGTQQAIYADNKMMTFAMQEEVKEAEAAVDACYWRRARRAGLGEMLPADRPMTEEELDYLSEQLGDRIGARARRRKEVEQMTLAEMEAELGGSRRRSREGGVRGRGGCP